MTASLHWVVSEIDTPVGPVPVAATELAGADRLGTIRVRLGIERMHYIVPPGLYAVGSPVAESPVFVSANYKLSFDRLRQELTGVDGWILVLDTNGVNVWCAAGKGTFGTAEIVARVQSVRLADIVSHRKLIAPQLGAPGVAAHEVKKQCGFRVVYGPVLARDIPGFLAADMKATRAMRRVNFTFRNRLAIVPVDIIHWLGHSVLIAVVLFLLGGLNSGGYDLSLALANGTRTIVFVMLACIFGGALVPALLPWLPGRAFSVKGAVVGVLLWSCIVLLGWMPTGNVSGGLEAVGWLLLIASAVGFVGMNFTGASTYTSMSGVKKEMRYAVPIEIAGAVVGLSFWLAARFA